MEASPEAELRAAVARAADMDESAAPDDTQLLLRSLRPLADAGPLDIQLLGTNEDRVDMAVTAEHGEWRVVCFAGADGTFRTVAVFERPDRFDGIPGGCAVVINGASGSGKSSVMKAVLLRARTPWVMFDEPWLGETQQPYLIWRDAAPLLHEGYLRGMAALARSGNQIVLSAGGNSPRVLEEAFAGIPTMLVGLDCPLAVLHDRERGRAGRWGGLSHASLNAHEGWSYNVRFDTSSLSSDEIAREVLACVDDWRS